MNDFNFSYPTKVFFGKGAAKKALAAELPKYGKNVMLAYGGGSVKRGGVYDELLSLLREAGKELSPQAMKEATVVTEAVRDILQLAAGAFQSGSLDKARQVEPLEEVIDILCDELKLHHVQRLQRGDCSVPQNFIFNDLITDLERVSDHCSNVAAGMLQSDTATYGTHDYLDKVKHAGSIFMGRSCPEALGDYLAGPNHTLPTGGIAKFASPLGVDDFMKKSQFSYYSREALEAVGNRQ